MPKSCSALLALALVLVAAGCGGGGDRDADGLVTIHRLDLEDADLDPLYFFNPPPEHSYPDVVAAVNGVEITGDSLASREVMLELGERQLRGALGDALPETFLAQELSDLESDDPLEDLINDELKRQAVERLGLLPSHEEAVAYTRQQEEDFTRPQATVSPEDKEQMLEMLRRLGFPTEDWASSERIVETYRQQMGLAQLGRDQCRPLPTPSPGATSYRGGIDCSDFLRQERARAEIVYYARWAD